MALSPVASLAVRPGDAHDLAGRERLVADPAERELVRRARQGDVAAREELAIAHRRAAYLLALQLLGNRDDALDASQDALLRFFSTLDRFRPEQPVRPWLYSIVRNRCRDLMRRGRVRRAESLDADEEHWRPELVDTSADPELDAERAELRRKVFAAPRHAGPGAPRDPRAARLPGPLVSGDRLGPARPPRHRDVAPPPRAQGAGRGAARGRGAGPGRH